MNARHPRWRKPFAIDPRMVKIKLSPEAVEQEKEFKEMMDRVKAQDPATFEVATYIADRDE